jgi:TolA-binding protein
MQKEAVAYARLGQTEQALKLMQAVMDNYPTSRAAEQCRVDIKKLKGQ